MTPPATTHAGSPRLGQLLRSHAQAGISIECRSPLDPQSLDEIRAWLCRTAGQEVSLDVRLNPRSTSEVALLVGDAFRIDLDAGRRLLQQVEEATAALPPDQGTTVDAAAAFLASALGTQLPQAEIETVASHGIVREVGDGVAFVAGLPEVGSQELVRFACGLDGIAFNLLEDTVGCLVLGPEARIEEGSAVEGTGRQLEVPVGEALIGRVVDGLGRAIDGGDRVVSDRQSPIEVLSPGVVQRRPVSVSLHTGIKSLDALVPLGRGQRELILGDRSIGKTTLALDIILSQKETGVVCVYAAIGQKASTLARTVGLLKQWDALDYTVVVAALAGEPCAFRYIAPYAACSIAEDFMRRGRHALVVYDDLSKHAVAYREISSLLKRPVGREAYPGDIFYVHSRLLERAAQLRDDLGGGSLTAIPIVETLAGDLSSLIPTNVISICDGQIVLDAGLFNEGFRPAMDVGLSVSRVGGTAQTPAMRKVAGRLRIDLAQHREMARFVKFGAEVDQATLAQLTRGERELELLKQTAHAPLPLEREVVLLSAAIQGYTDAIPLARLPEFEKWLFDSLERDYPEVPAAIRETGDLSAETEHRLTEALAQARDRFSSLTPAGA